MLTIRRGIRLLTIVAITCTVALWGCTGVTDPHTRALTRDVESASVETISGTDDDAALAAVAGAGAGLAAGLVYDQRSERRAYGAGYLTGRQAQPPPPPQVLASPPPVAPPPPPLAPPVPPPAPPGPLLAP
jgi:hypothetical protein